VFLCLPWFSTFVLLAVAAFNVIAWIRSYWTLWGRIGYTLFTAVVLGYLWFLWFWNFLWEIAHQYHHDVRNRLLYKEAAIHATPKPDRRGSQGAKDNEWGNFERAFVGPGR
jgi:hypothetical protein